MKKRHLRFLASLLLLQAVCTSFGKLSAQTLSADTLSWSWEVSTTTSTMTKSCTLEFTGPLTLDWGDGAVQTLSDSLSGIALTHIYSSVANFNCVAIGTGILYFKADSRRLLTMNPTKSPALTYLSCTSNQLAALNVSKNTELISLYCGGNALTSLNVSNCTKLQTLTCSDNALTLLDVSGVASLKKLTCHTNLLSSLRVCPTGSLSYISSLNCNLQVAALDTLFAQLPALAVVPTSKNLYVLNNPGSANCNIQLANLKNWYPDKLVTSSSFYMPAVTSTTGALVELDVCLTNPVPVIAFELDVAFPTGFVLDTVQSCLAAARKGNHLLSMAQTATDQYKFLIYSMTTGDKIRNNSGVVLQLFGKAPNTAKVCVVQLKQAVLVDTTTNMCAVTVSNGSLTVMPASVNGDVNGDKEVNVTDVVNLVAYINGQNPAGFSTMAADLDNNGFLNVADITKLVVIINASGVTLRSSSIEATAERSLVLYDKQSAVAGNNLYVRQSTSSKNCLELCLDNVTPIQAFQVDIRLPEGVSLHASSVSGKTFRQNGHVIQVSSIGWNNYRLLAYALRPDAAFKGDTGVLVVLPLMVTETLPASNYPVYLNAPVLTGMNLTTVSSHGFDLSANLGSLQNPDRSMKAFTDGHSGLWVQGMGLTEVYVWNLSGKLLEHQRLDGTSSFNACFPKGVYVVRARSNSKTELNQKVMVR